MKKQLKTITTYLSPAMLTLLMGIVILAVQGIWPFGGNTVDFYDMGQQIAAEYIQIYDEMHASKSIFFDWYLMAGHGIPGGTYISVLNIFLYFMPRDMILEFFSIFLLIKIMLMAVTMRMCIKSEVPECPDFYGAILSAGYGICGYVLLMYTIIAWLDIAILVPLIVTLARRVITEGRIGSFVICMTLAFWLGFYIPAMVLIYVFLSMGLFLAIRRLSGMRVSGGKITIAPSEGNVYVIRLGLAVAISLALSAFIWIPDLMQASGSMRYNIEGENTLLGQYMDIVKHVQPDYATRLWAFLGISFAAAATVVGIIRDIRRRNIKRVAFIAGNIVLVCAGYVFESIQLFWCFGSYVNYPARNGFLVYIVFALAAAKYIPELISENSGELAADKKVSKVRVYSRGRMVGYDEEIKTGLNILVGAALVVSFLLCCAGIYWYQSGVGRSIYDVFRVTVLCMVGAFAVYLLLILCGHGRYAKLAVFIICAELIFYGVALVGEPNYYTGFTEGAEQESEYIRISNSLKNELGIEPSFLDRMKNPDNSLNANFGRFMQRGTIAGWLPSTASGVISSAAAMGYTTQFTRVLTSGGNVFTDAIMHVTQAVSCLPLDEGVYDKVSSAGITVDKKTGEKRTYSLYDTKYRLSFGTLVRDEDVLNAMASSNMGTEWYNAVYDAISLSGIGDDAGVKGADTSSDFACVIDKTAEGLPVNFDGDNNEIAIEGKKALYLSTYSVDAEFENIEISINGKIIDVPTIGDVSNTRFPTQFNNNCMFLGSFENENVIVRVDKDASIEAPEYNFTLYTIDLNMLSMLCNSYGEKSQDMIFTAGRNSLNAQIGGADEGSYLLLPVAFDEGWTAKVNGEYIRPVPMGGLMMAIPLSGGNNVVKMTYMPATMKVLLVLFVLVLVLCAVYEMLLEKVKRTRVEGRLRIVSRLCAVESRIDPVLSDIYCAVWGLVIIGMYIIPAIYGIVFYVLKLI